MNELPDIATLQQGMYILWGGAASAYSTKLRAYLINKQIDYVELHPSHPHFKQHVLPQVGHFTLPVLETPEGCLIADSTDALDYLERIYPQRPMHPGNRIMAAIAQIIHSYGSDGLLKTMMYYRWATTHANRRFILDEFARMMFQPEERSLQAVSEFSSQFRAYLKPLGIRDDHRVDLSIEASADKLYGILNAHFSEYPYLLGGLPSMADYGLLMGLQPHQGRDPVTCGELKMRAPSLNRWMETMNRRALTDPELYLVPPVFIEPEAIPSTLKDLLKLIFSDYGSEIIATALAYSKWLKQEERPTGTIITHDTRPAVHQRLEEITHTQQGAEIKRTAFLDCLIQHQRLERIIETMDASERTRLRALAAESGGQAVIDLRLEQPMERVNNVYVVAETQVAAFSTKPWEVHPAESANKHNSA